MRCDLYRMPATLSVLSLITLGMRNVLQCHVSGVTPTRPLIGQYLPQFRDLIGRHLTSWCDPRVSSLPSQVRGGHFLACPLLDILRAMYPPPHWSVLVNAGLWLAAVWRWWLGSSFQDPETDDFLLHRGNIRSGDCHKSAMWLSFINCNKDRGEELWPGINEDERSLLVQDHQQERILWPC